MTDTEQLSTELAAQNARQNPRLPGVPPHHLRCDWIRGDFDELGPKLRCRLGDGHTGEHVYEE